ncbi:MAG: permease [Oscillatoria sp. PMC 1068.18]|nr:permease [Oscillatoria sp. PMC 1076.18]MEC4989562.1 permease [Oscillatoria sp. PMC 1068.18]
MTNIFTLFFSLLFEAIPFLLLGIIVSSLLLVFASNRLISARLPNHPLLGAIVGSCLGLILPVCEYGNIPVARRMLLQKVPTPIVIGFLIGAPTINPLTIWVTWIAFSDRLEIVILRVVLVLIVAAIVGWVFHAQPDPDSLLRRWLKLPQHQPNVASSTAIWQQQRRDLLHSGTFLVSPHQTHQPNVAISTTKYTLFGRLSLVLDNIVLELRQLGIFLVCGCAIAAILQVIIPRAQLLNLGVGSISAVVVMMLLGMLVSTSSILDAFFIRAFTSSFSSGALLAYLVFGAIADWKSISLIFSIFRPRVALYLLLLVAQLTFLLTSFINLKISY